MKLLFASFILILIQANLISCDCIEYLRFSDSYSVSFENSDLVLIADVIESGKEYKFVVIEKFKL